MHILIITAVYPPEPVVSARLSADLRNHLVSEGHSVHVLCPQPSRGIHAESQHPEQDDTVTRLPSYHCKASSFIGRLRESFDFGCLAARWLQTNATDVDVVYTLMWPIFGPFVFSKAAAGKGIPVIRHVMDVYPESLVTKLPQPLYYLCQPLLLALDRVVACRCAATILLSEKIAARYEKIRKISDRVQVIRNWVDAEPFAVSHVRKEVCSEYDVPADRFTFMYLGNISALSGLDTAIRAFAALESDEVQMVVVGEGSEKATCMKLVRELSLPNVLFRSEQDANRVARIQTMADVFLLPTCKGGATSSTPSKCISYMLSGKPIVASVDRDSDVADDLLHANCALICQPDNQAEFLQEMKRIIQMPADDRKKMSENGRSFALKTFDKMQALRRLEKIIISFSE